MRMGFKLAAIAGAVAMAVSGVASAASHPAFGGYTFNADKTIGLDTGTDATCNGFSCDVIARGDGFVQFMAKNNDTGETYIGTIVHDETAGAGGATNTFSDESYIKMQLSTGGTANNDINGGIADKQGISETSNDGTVFKSDVLLSTGLFKPDTTNPTTIQINQSLGNGNNGTALVVGDDFQTDFMYAASTTDAGVRTGFKMEIDQIAGLQTSTDQTTSSNDVQAFTYREVAGTDQTGSGTLRVSSSDSLSYASGEDIKAVWLGQDVNIGGGTSSGLGGSFSYLSYENKGFTTGENPQGSDNIGVISTFDLAGSTAPDSANWGAGTTSPFNLTFPNGTTSGVPTSTNPSGVQ